MSLKDLLAELQQNYLASIPEKSQTIDGLWKSKSFDLLETEYHKLKGTGRTYGLPEVTLLGEALERLCELKGTALSWAVPLSLELLERIRQSRLKGEAFSIDDDPDFIKIAAAVQDITNQT